ncbi:hypothetical protein C8R45DRAFT_1117314 [Mycena sanguinolenta]|nr:hypothetical protein C8R45DRAFT_1117314 [Mycena sanguinolenta]
MCARARGMFRNEKNVQFQVAAIVLVLECDFHSNLSCASGAHESAEDWLGLQHSSWESLGKFNLYWWRALAVEKCAYAAIRFIQAGKVRANLIPTGGGALVAEKCAYAAIRFAQRPILEVQHQLNCKERVVIFEVKPRRRAKTAPAQDVQPSAGTRRSAKQCMIYLRPVPSVQPLSHPVAWRRHVSPRVADYVVPGSNTRIGVGVRVLYVSQSVHKLGLGWTGQARKQVPSTVQLARHTSGSVVGHKANELAPTNERTND